MKRLSTPLRVLRLLLPSWCREDALQDAIQECRRLGATRGRVKAWLWCWRQVFSIDLLRLRRESWETACVRAFKRPEPFSRKVDRMLQGFRNDLRCALRRLARRPSYALLVIVTLGMGIGGAAAVFSVVDAVLLKPLPYPHSERLASVGHTAQSIGSEIFLTSGLTSGAFFVYGEESRSLQDLAVYFPSGVDIETSDRPRRVEAASSSHNLFSVLGTPPAMGRDFTSEDDSRDAPAVAIISHRLWLQAFGGQSSVIGRSVRLAGREAEIVGVMPRGFHYPSQDTELWLPLGLDRTRARSISFQYRGIARLAQDVTPSSAQSELDSLFARPFELYPTEGISAQELRSQGFRVSVRDLKDTVIGDIGQILWILMAVAGLILLVAVANAVSLILVRAQDRQRELALQTAVGASRLQLVRYFLIESSLLGLAAAGFGLALAWAGIQLLRYFSPQELPRLAEIGIGANVFLFASLLFVAVVLLFGLIPVARLTSARLDSSLKEGARGAGGGTSNRTRSVLVSGQLATAVVLMAAAGLMLQSAWNLRAVDPGFRRDHLLLFDLSLPHVLYTDSDAVIAFHRRAIDRLRELPGIVDASAAARYFGLPLYNPSNPNPVWVEDRPVPPGSMPEPTPIRIVLPRFFETLGIPLRAGRGIEERDIDQGTGAVVVSESFAHKTWQDQDPLGKRLAAVPGWPWMTVVGVAADIKQTSLNEATPSAVYWGVRLQDGRAYTDASYASYAIRTLGDPLAALPRVREAIAELDGGLALARVQTMRQTLSQSIIRVSFTTVLLGIAAGIALLLGAVGTYGVMSQSVTRRTREIGVRMALGAEPASILNLVLKQAALVTGLGVAVGLTAAVGVLRLLDALLFGVRPVDAGIYLVVAFALGASALMAGYLPARRAAAIDPIQALRCD